MYISITELPKRYREQISAGLCFKSVDPKENKYRNQKAVINKIQFDSKKEALRYEELSLMYSAEIIKDLRLQHTFTLQEPYTKPSGERVRGISYKADFTYWKDGEFIVEDVKSAATRKDKVYRMKVKMMEDKLGVTVREV